MSEIKKENVVETKQPKIEEKVIKQLNPEELVVKSEEGLALIRKKFTDLTKSDLEKHVMCLAKVYEEEQTVRFGREQKKQKLWKCAVQIAPGVVISRNITEEEINLIKLLNPELISPKAKLTVPVKCMTGLTDDGNRYFRIVACLCDNVYIGSSRNNRYNSGFLSKVQISTLVANNRLAKSNPSLQPIKFVEITKDVDDLLTESLEDRYSSILDDNF